METTAAVGGTAHRWLGGVLRERREELQAAGQWTPPPSCIDTIEAGVIPTPLIDDVAQAYQLDGDSLRAWLVAVGLLDRARWPLARVMLMLRPRHGLPALTTTAGREWRSSLTLCRSYQRAQGGPDARGGED